MFIDCYLLVLFILVVICLILAAYYIGTTTAIRNDLKSVLYDRLDLENIELKKTIDKMMQIKKERKK